MTLPTREEIELAPGIDIEGWTQLDIERVCEVVEAYADGVLQTREEWLATIDYEAAAKMMHRTVGHPSPVMPEDYEVRLHESSHAIVDAAVGKDKQ